MNSRFPRSARVRARADFDRIFKEGRRVAAPVLTLHWQSGDQPARLGLAVSRKVDPDAVGRNRIKRALRETFRRTRTQLAAGDYVVVARVGAAQVLGSELGMILLNLLRRAGALPADALPPPPVPGTMPAASVGTASSEPAAPRLDPESPGPTSP